MKNKIIIALTIAAISISSLARNISGVEVLETIQAKNFSLNLNGAGVRSKVFMDLYVGSLFTEQPTQSSQLLINGDYPSAIRLNITSGMITASKLTEALNEGFQLATNGNTAMIDESINDFIEATFREEVKKGDQFTFVSAPNDGLYSYKNEILLDYRNDDAFRKALLSVWLGDKPTDKKLKKQMLGG
ncbi:chalcone isomerase family protein [Vibrio metschnikovii]|uniref:chalcone isomerase family protein n=1 Tax=Vibrio metschnikovii TaxID=28172 RepID=UPI001C307D48|nr:chalcone isomerase family protein [Vibrio metschnikovii]